MDLDRRYYQHLLTHSVRIPALYAKSKYIRLTMPTIPAAEKDWKGTTSDSPAKRLLCLGESTMAGVGLTSLKAGLPGLIARNMAHHGKEAWMWDTVAYVGYSIKQLLAKVQDRQAPNQADLTLVAIGGNDTFYLTKPSSWLTHIDQLCQWIHRHQPKSKIVFASMPPAGTFPSFGKYMRAFVGGQNQLLREAIVDYCKNQKDSITFVEQPVVFEEYVQRSESGTTMADMFCDGYHPSAITYRLWAEDICHHIQAVYPNL